MEHLYLGMISRKGTLDIQKCSAEVGILDVGLLRIIIRDNKRTQQRFTRWYRKRNMIQTGTLPGGSRLLPLPYVVIVRHYANKTDFLFQQFCVQNYYKKSKYTNKSGIFCTMRRYDTC